MVAQILEDSFRNGNKVAFLVIWRTQSALGLLLHASRTHCRDLPIFQPFYFTFLIQYFSIILSFFFPICPHPLTMFFWCIRRCSFLLLVSCNKLWKEVKTIKPVSLSLSSLWLSVPALWAVRRRLCSLNWGQKLECHVSECCVGVCSAVQLWEACVCVSCIPAEDCLPGFVPGIWSSSLACLAIQICNVALQTFWVARQLLQWNCNWSFPSKRDKSNPIQVF